MVRLADIVMGMTVNRWTVIGMPARDNHNYFVPCRCACGTIRRVEYSKLLSGHSKSCGCWGREVAGARFRRHGKTGSRTHKKWLQMVNRCSGTDPHKAKYYAGRGITVCSQWKDFAVFFRDMGECPEGYSLDRIDNEKGYSPDNCRWVPLKQQHWNKRTSRIISYLGRSQCMAAWAYELNIPYDTLKRRIYSGLPPEIAFVV